MRTDRSDKTWQPSFLFCLLPLALCLLPLALCLLPLALCLLPLALCLLPLALCLLPPAFCHTTHYLCVESIDPYPKMLQIQNA
jgi:hypothetical protein